MNSWMEVTDTYYVLFIWNYSSSKLPAQMTASQGMTRLYEGQCDIITYKELIKLESTPEPYIFLYISQPRNHIHCG